MLAGVWRTCSWPVRSGFFLAFPDSDEIHIRRNKHWLEVYGCSLVTNIIGGLN